MKTRFVSHKPNICDRTRFLKSLGIRMKQKRKKQSAWGKSPIHMIPLWSKTGKGAISMVSRMSVVSRLVCRCLIFLDRCVRGPSPAGASGLLAHGLPHHLFLSFSLIINSYLSCLIPRASDCVRRYRPSSTLKNVDQARQAKGEKALGCPPSIPFTNKPQHL